MNLGYNGYASRNEPGSASGSVQPSRPAGAGAPRIPGSNGNGVPFTLLREPDMSPFREDMYQAHRNDDYRKYANIPTPKLPGADLGISKELGFGSTDLVASPTPEPAFLGEG